MTMLLLLLLNLQFAVRESVTANTLSLAKSALQQLLALMQAQDKNKTAADTTTGHDANGSDTASCLSECVVIRALVKLQQQELEQHLSSAAAVATDAQKELDQQQQQTAPVQACIAELSETLNSANVRAKRLGVEQFTGEKEAAALQQVEWLSMCAWNAALQAAGEECTRFEAEAHRRLRCLPTCWCVPLRVLLCQQLPELHTLCM